MKQWDKTASVSDKFKKPVMLIARKSGHLSVGPSGGDTGLTWSLFITQDYKETKKSYLVKAGGYDYRLEKDGRKRWSRYNGGFIEARFHLAETAGELWWHMQDAYEHIKERNRELRKKNYDLRRQIKAIQTQFPDQIQEESSQWTPVKEKSKSILKAWEKPFEDGSSGACWACKSLYLDDIDGRYYCFHGRKETRMTNSCHHNPSKFKCIDSDGEPTMTKGKDGRIRRHE